VTDWTEHATCRGMDLSHFFPVRGQSLEPAKAACARCPVRQACLDEANAIEMQARGFVFGFRGGLSPDGRIAYRHNLRAAS
jgi:hypothetical protein